MIKVGDIVVHEELNKAAIILALIYSPMPEESNYQDLELLLEFSEDIGSSDEEYKVIHLRCRESAVSQLGTEELLELVTQGLQSRGSTTFNLKVNNIINNL